MIRWAIWAATATLLICSVFIGKHQKLNLRIFIPESHEFFTETLKLRRVFVLKEHMPNSSVLLTEGTDFSLDILKDRVYNVTTRTKETSAAVFTSFYPNTPSGLGARYFGNVTHWPRDACRLLGLVTILTMPAEQEVRLEFRDLINEIPGDKIRPVFPVFVPVTRVQSSDDEVKPIYYDQVIAEYDQYGDLLIIDGVESYSLLPTKVLGGMEYFIRECEETKYFIKQDADMLTNWGVVVKALEVARVKGDSEMKLNELWFGLPMIGQPVLHNSHKNADPDLKSLEIYPPYASGPFYVLCRELVEYVILARIKDPRQLINEDATIGLMLEPLHLKPARIPLLYKSSWLPKECGENIANCSCDKWWSISNLAFDKKDIFMEIRRCLESV